MHIKSLTITNCKSFRYAEEISFDDQFTILVGPNGGGKSNTLDILTIILRRFFLPAYIVAEGEDRGVPWQDIQRPEVFNSIQQYLDPYVDTSSEDVRIRLTLVVTGSDIHNFSAILSHRPNFVTAFQRFRNSHQDVKIFNSWDSDPFVEGQEFQYEIFNGSLQPYGDTSQRIFYQYLYSLNFFLILAAETDIIQLHPSTLYFSPYRGTTPQDLRANLSNEQFLGQLAQYSNPTSQSQSSLIKVATLYFAEKKRKLEALAHEQGYVDRWESDQDVVRMSHYMQQLSYLWDLVLLDANRNIYEIQLQRENRIFAISKASSGEKEIL